MTHLTIEKLQTTFWADGITFSKDSSGLIIVNISNKLATASISLHGAHLLSFIPSGQEDVIFLSKKAIFKEGVPVRGGIPVCWPWFGDHLTDREIYSHGFARRNLWDVKSVTKNSDDSNTVIFKLHGKKGEFDSWPYSFEAELKVTVSDTLSITLTTNNTSDKPFTITNALHTYFNISDIGNIEIEGLKRVDYQDDVDGEKIKTENGNITINQEVDRVYMKTSSTCKIIDSGFNRAIDIAKEGSETTVVWNPWKKIAASMKDMADDEYRNMVCIEAVNTFDDKRTVMPGENHSITQIIKSTKL
ncbi:MAG: D-hexose-6-phosphate mutarotase [Deltaproteobacteria bacterium]|nr:D-hexose-6-phosphate mutarotase [Deltaproteobacteria bacterium]